VVVVKYSCVGGVGGGSGWEVNVLGLGTRVIVAGHRVGGGCVENSVFAS
jgi:hypothetical protein